LSQDTNNRIQDTGIAARFERLSQGEMVQTQRAVRYPVGADIKIFEVQSDTDGDGVYICYEQSLLGKEWDDTDGDDRFANKDETPVEVEVLNLEESDAESDYTRALSAGDRLYAWKMTDVIVAEIGGISRENGIVTVTLSSSEGFVEGKPVLIADVEDSSFDGAFTISSVASNQITYPQAGNSHAESTGGTATGPSTIRYVGRPFIKAGLTAEAKIFEVISNADGSGVYNCHEQKIIPANWTGGDADKFEEKNDDSVEVLNLYENCPTAANQHDLAAGDRLIALQLPGVSTTQDILEIMRYSSSDVLALVDDASGFPIGGSVVVAEVSDESLNGTFTLTDVVLEVGNNYIQWTQAGSNVDISNSGTATTQVKKWAGMPLDEVGGTRRAYCKTAAPAATEIICYLDVNTTGSEITVKCSISGGGNLNMADRRLAVGDVLFVQKFGSEWWCVEGFTGDENCICQAPT
jgi:hypothetical protein